MLLEAADVEPVAGELGRQPAYAGIAQHSPYLSRQHRRPLQVACRGVSEQLGINTHRWALAAAAADLRGMGYPDLFIANDYGVSELFFNRQGKRFDDAGERTGVGFAPKSGMNAAFGDILNQGRFAIYVSNISEEGVLIQGNNLWIPREGTTGDAIKYDNMARDMGVDLGSVHGTGPLGRVMKTDVLAYVEQQRTPPPEQSP